MSTATSDIYQRLASQIAGEATGELRLQFRRKPEQGTLLIIAERRRADHHAQLTKEANGTLTYRQRGLRKTPGTPTKWTKNSPTNQPVMTIANLAQESLEMYIDAVEHALPRGFKPADPDVRRTIATAIENAANSREEQAPPRTRDLRRRLQKLIDTEYANDTAALDLLETLIGQQTPRDRWTINQYNAAILRPALITAAHSRTPHICQTYLLHTVNLPQHHTRTLPETLEEMAALTGWNRITGTLRTSPAPTNNTRLRNAAAAIRDAHASDPCSVLAKTIWSDTDLHWALRQLHENDERTWPKWTHIIAQAFANHPPETEVHRHDQPLYHDTLARGSQLQRSHLTGTVSCLAQASTTLHIGRLLAAALDQGKTWPELTWAQYAQLTRTIASQDRPGPDNTPGNKPDSPPGWPSRVSQVNILGYDIQPATVPETLPSEVRTPETIEACHQNRTRYFLVQDSKANHVATIELTRTNMTWNPGRTITPNNAPPEPALEQVARILATKYQYSHTETRTR